jgi:uncharacterized protein (TIRG00374 family)
MDAAPAGDWRRRLPALRRAGLWTIVGCVAAYAVVGIAVEGGPAARQGLPAPQHLDLLPLILLMAPLNYALRFVKWHLYTLRLGFHQVPWRGNLLVFLSGMGLTLTPGKVGELFKSWLLWDRYGVPSARSAPMVVADRVTDGCAMLALASVGAVLLGRGHIPWVLIAAVLVLIALVRSRRTMLAVVRLLARVPRLRSLEHKLLELLDATQALFALDLFGAAFGLGCVGWGLEGLLVYFVLGMFGYSFAVGASVFVVASSAIAGGVSPLPGGVGAAEAVMIALLLWLRVPLSLAVVTTLIVRFATLWLGVAIGLVCLGFTGGRAAPARAPAP